jgi:F-type H+-transporting ATPase subunit epsilon
MAAEKKSFTISVLKESEVIYYGDCNSLTVPSLKDPITILPFHTPLIMKLGPGPILMRTGGQKQVLATVKTGLLYVGENEVTVLVDL